MGKKEINFGWNDAINQIYSPKMVVDEMVMNKGFHVNQKVRLITQFFWISELKDDEVVIRWKEDKNDPTNVKMKVGYHHINKIK